MPEISWSSTENVTIAKRCFWLFIIIHTLLWTLGPALARPTLPHDSLEGITWGIQWQLGYNKHPFLTAWLCAGFTEFFQTVGWPIYLLAQLAVSMTFFAVWRLARELLPELHALIATLCLEGVLFYNINSFNFTPDTLQSPLWALLSLFFYKALIRQKISSWIACGLFASLSVCTKYQVFVLFLPMLFLCIFNTQARTSFTKPGIYIAFFVFLLVLTPHLLWLYQHDFITLTYAEKVSSDYTQNQSLANVLRFFINCLFNVSGLFFLLWPFYKQSKINLNLSIAGTHNSLQKQFLITVGLGPLLVSLLLSLITRDYFPPRWATPYFFALGILAVFWIQPKLSIKTLKQFALTLILFSSLLFLGRMVSLTLLPRTESDAFLPNQQIALAVEQVWKQHYTTPLRYIAGSNYLVSLITPYIPDKPKPYLNWDHIENPWINEEELRLRGAIFIWDEGRNYAWDLNSKTHGTLPESVLNRFPRLNILPNYTFYRSSDYHPIIIGIAILPPQDN